MVKIKFAHLSKCLKIVWTWLSAECSFTFYVFMPLLTALIVKISFILTGIYFTFLKNIGYYTINIKFAAHQKIGEVFIKQDKFSHFFHVLVALILGWNCVKDLRVTKNCQTFQIWRTLGGELEAKSCLQRQSFTKCFRQTLVFMWKSVLRVKSISFFSSFLLIFI